MERERESGHGGRRGMRRREEEKRWGESREERETPQH